MKKKSIVISLLLSLAMIMGTFTAVFADEAPIGKPTDFTRDAISGTNIRCIIKVKDELGAENMAIKFAEDVAIGGYGLANTDEVKELQSKGAVILDTMPDLENKDNPYADHWFSSRHIPGAINAQAGDRWEEKETGSFEVFGDNQRENLLKVVTEKVGTDKVTKYQNKKTKKVISKAKYKKLSKKNKKKYNKITVEVPKKDTPIVVYCGFVGCRRSHQAARFLVEQGFKNVYRYPGGIAAWTDGGNDIQGTDVAK